MYLERLGSGHGDLEHDFVSDCYLNQYAPDDTCVATDRAVAFLAMFLCALAATAVVIRWQLVSNHRVPTITCDAAP